MNNLNECYYLNSKNKKIPINDIRHKVVNLTDFKNINSDWLRLPTSAHTTDR